MQIKTIQSILKLYETGNISRASEKLFLTQQGLSRQIQMVEKELGEPLFLRSKNGVTPTELCRELYPHFQAIYGEYESVLALVQQQRRERKGILTVGFASGSASGVGTEFLIDFQKKYPGLSLEIQEWPKDVCLAKLLNDNLDIAFLVNPFDTAGLSVQLLFYDHMYAAMHKTNPLAAATTPLDFACLAGEKIITGPSDNVLRQFFDYCCSQAQIRPQILVSSDFNINYVNSMTTDVGLSTLTSIMVRQITNPDIRVRQLILPIPGGLYGVRPAQGKNQTQAALLMKFTLQYFAKNPIGQTD